MLKQTSHSWVRSSVGCLSLLALSVLLWSCGNGGENNNNNNNNEAKPAVNFSASEKAIIWKLSPLGQIPEDPTNKYYKDEKAAHLGQYFFYEKRISSNGKISCATCHAPDKGFGDNKPLSKGLDTLLRHAPALYNTAYNRWFYWDGRIDSLWAQALGPIEAVKEMAFSRLELAHFINKNKDIKDAYNAIFDDKFPDISDSKRFPDKGMPGVDAFDSMEEADQKLINRVFANVAKSIAAYERKLISKDSPFDTFVEGWKKSDKKKLGAMTESAQRGLRLFIGKARCILCHFGPNFTNREFHNIGLDRIGSAPLDQGRFKVIDSIKKHPFNGMSEYSDIPKEHEHNDKLRYLTQISHNLGEFKTPSLRSVATHAPYMHDGRFKALKDVINHYNKPPKQAAIGAKEEILIELKLTESEKGDLVEFLKSLTGKPLPGGLLQQPTSPKL